MELRIDKKRGVCIEDIEVGDIVICGGIPYIIRYSSQYQAQSLSGVGGATGSHNNIESLRKALNGYVSDIYLKSEYQLVLEKV